MIIYLNNCNFISVINFSRKSNEKIELNFIVQYELKTQKILFDRINNYLIKIFKKLTALFLIKRFFFLPAIYYFIINV